MDEKELVDVICSYLKILSTLKKADDKLKLPKSREPMFKTLETNMETVMKDSIKYPHLNQVIMSYIREPNKTLMYWQKYWNFSLFCLVLLKGLNELLQSRKVGKDNEEDSEFTHEQEESISKCIELVIASGLLPNVLPGVRVILKENDGLQINLEHEVDSYSSVQLKYYRLVTTMLILTECLEQKAIRELILSQYSLYILVAMLQLCHATIKSCQDEDVPNEQRSAYMLNKGAMKDVENEKYLDLNWIMSKLRGIHSEDNDFIRDMWEERYFFMGRFQKLLTYLPTSVLFPHLLFILGVNVGKAETKVLKEQIKVPKWLMTACNNLLTNKLVEKNGVRMFIQVFFDSMTDDDIKAGTLTQERIEAAARVISTNPAGNIPLKSYIEKIMTQIVGMLHCKENAMKSIYNSTSSFIVEQFADRNLNLAETCISHSLFKPLSKCLSIDDNAMIFEGDVIAGEEDLTNCIEDAWIVFVGSRAIIDDNAISLIGSYYHLLFSFYAKFCNSVLFYKSKLLDLLAAVINSQSRENCVDYLLFAMFNNPELPEIEVTSNVRFAFGSSGGAEILRCDNQNTDYEELAEIIETKCRAMSHLLQRISDKRVKSLFYMSVLKKCTHKKLENENEEIMKTFLLEKLIAMRLLEDLGENICDDLVDDIDETIKLIKAALECGISSDGDENEDLLFSEDTLLSFLIILSTLIGYKDQLKSSQWSALKECLPPLEALMTSNKNIILINMAKDVSAAIKTQGEVVELKLSNQKIKNKDQTKSKEQMKPKESLFSQGDSKMLIEEISNITFSDAQKFALEHSGSPNKEKLGYQIAVEEASDSNVAIRGHGLISLAKLIKARDVEILSNKKEVFDILQKNLSDEESYVYLPAINGLSALADIDTDMVLPLLLSKFQKSSSDDWSYTLKVGEALLKVCRNLGELAPKYRDQFLSKYLVGVKHDDPHIRASCLSNLGEVCKLLKFSIGPMLQEILHCVTAMLKTDHFVEVRRAAMLVISLLLQGTGKDVFIILEKEIKDLYSLVKHVYATEKDDILKLQAQVALEELNAIVKDSLQQKQTFVKEIRV